MVSIRNNYPNSLTINYVGGQGQLTLAPGVNLNIPKAEWDAAKRHPVVQTWIKVQRIDVLTRTPTTKGELAGFEVSDRKSDDQPIPHQPARLGADSLKPNNAKPATLEGIAISDAKQIIQSTYDLDRLKQWKSDERKGIQELLDSQIQEVSG